jgi:hypothetical protein
MARNSMLTINSKIGMRSVSTDIGSIIYVHNVTGGTISGINPQARGTLEIVSSEGVSISSGTMEVSRLALNLSLSGNTSIFLDNLLISNMSFRNGIYGEPASLSMTIVNTVNLVAFSPISFPGDIEVYDDSYLTIAGNFSCYQAHVTGGTLEVRGMFAAQHSIIVDSYLFLVLFIIR